MCTVNRMKPSGLRREVVCPQEKGARKRTKMQVFYLNYIEVDYLPWNLWAFWVGFNMRVIRKVGLHS